MFLKSNERSEVKKISKFSGEISSSQARLENFAL